MYRNTSVLVNLNNIYDNVKNIINKHKDYDYYFAVVKANAYGHGIKVISKMIEAGCNYLVVALLEEAISIRKEYPNIPILCLGIIEPQYLNDAINNNVTITVNSLDYAKEIIKYKGLKVHLKVNTGMNRLGINNQEELIDTFNLLKKNNIEVEGIYTHIYNALDNKDTETQFKEFDYLLTDRLKKDIPIIHICASDALELYPKPSYVNGCRLGIIMYGLNNNSSLKSTFSLVSEIIQINHLKKGETLGYNGAYTASEDEFIGVVSIGYADGIIRKNTGRYVYINEKAYPIVGNICMDMLFVKIDNNINLHDQVFILKDNTHIKEIAAYLDTIPYEILCSITYRVPRIYL